MINLGKLVDRLSWPVYCRSYLATLGGLLLGICWLAVTREPGGISALSPVWQFGLSVILLAAIALVVIGLAGPSKRIERWAESWSKHEIALLVMLLALPLYLVLAPLYRRR